MSSAGNEDLGLQVKPMGLKVHYTFDKDSQDRCLARHPQVINAQTLALDETTTIGLVDIRLCLQAVSQCSPELLSAFDSDYVVYAYDYSEPGAPLVGQGMLSWLLDPNRRENANQSLNMVTGRVTKNMLAIFGNGIKETLEVKLKLVKNSKLPRTDQGQNPQVQAFSQQSQMSVGTPQLGMGLPSQSMDAGTPSAEWNFFMQSMPAFDAQAHMDSPLPMDDVNAHINHATPNTTTATTNPQPAQNASTTTAQAAPSGGSSRPASRTSRKRQPTGRPRGRPRKRPPAEGHTSGYEDGTDGDDNPGPARKRVATTKVSDRAVSAPFATTPESLRVAASTSGSLRSFRPPGAGGSEGQAAGSHLQDQPRAPTPVPNADKLNHPGRGGGVRRPSALGQEPSNLSACQSFTNSQIALSPDADNANTPSVAPTPAAFSEDSGAEIGSSPPVPRTSRYMQSSPPPSSPVLPPIPRPHDSGFMSGGVEENTQFGDNKFDGCMTDAPSAPPQPPKEKEKEKDKDKVPVQYFRLQEGKGGTQDLVQVVSPYSIKPVDASDGPKRSRSERRGSQPGQRPSSVSGHDVQRASSAHPNFAGRQSPALQPGPAQGQGQAPNSQRSTPTPPQDQGQAYPPQAPPAARPPPTSRQPTPASVPAQAQPGTTDFQLPPATDGAGGHEQFHLPQANDVTNGNEQFHQPQAADATNGHEQHYQPPASDAPNDNEQSGQLSRSQSMGAVTFADSHAETKPAPSQEEETSKTAPPQPAAPQSNSSMPQSASFNDLPPPRPPIPASDPVGPQQQADPPSEAPCPASDAMRPAQTSPPPAKSNKNYVKKQSIKERLERAVMNGEMPQYCSNCGAIETPTWRKISTQNRDGVPEYYDYSEKPGHVTAVEVLERDATGRPTKHRIIKKNLAPEEDKSLWQTRLLCNPCGIWLSKNNRHRPEERWAKDHERLGQERRRRGTGRNPTRRKKSSGKDSRGSVPPLTSEANIPTDPPASEGMTPDMGAVSMDHLASILETANSREFDQHIDRQKEQSNNQTTASGRSGFSNAESRGTGTANSPIAVDLEEDLGSTRRLLFPSPRHKGSRDALNPISPNVVTQGPQGGEENKEIAVEAAEETAQAENGYRMPVEDELESLFRSPVAPRPSTPPPGKGSSGTKSHEFKTPSKTPSRATATPTHRPITRSISKTIRSVQSSPIAQLAMLQTTPTKTPRQRLLAPESPSLRRSPRINGSAAKTGGGGGLGALGEMEMSSQADLEAILDKCLGSWPDGSRGWEDELGSHEWDLEALGLEGMGGVA